MRLSQNYDFGDITVLFSTNDMAFRCWYHGALPYYAGMYAFTISMSQPIRDTRTLKAANQGDNDGRVRMNRAVNPLLSGC